VPPRWVSRATPSCPVEPPQRDLGPRGKVVVRLGDDRERIGRREGRDDVTPLRAREMYVHAPARVAHRRADVVALRLHADERPATVALANLLAEDGAIEGTKDVVPAPERPDRGT